MLSDNFLLVIGAWSFQAALYRQQGFLFQRVVAGLAGLEGAGLTDGADPVEVATPPDVGKADEQDGEERADIDDSDPGQLPGAFVDNLLGRHCAARSDWRQRRRNRLRYGRISNAELAIKVRSLRSQH